MLDRLFTCLVVSTLLGMLPSCGGLVSSSGTSNVDSSATSPTEAAPAPDASNVSNEPLEASNDTSVPLKVSSEASEPFDVSSEASEPLDVSNDTFVPLDVSTEVNERLDAGGMDGTDAAGRVVPCTIAGQTGCFPCFGNINRICTPTETLIVERDVGKGLIKSDVPNMNPWSSCYSCLVDAGCIDSTNAATFNSGFECGDLSGTVGAGAQAAETKTQACLNTLACILGDPSMSSLVTGGYSWTDSYQSCARDGIVNCYCGPAFPTVTTCAGGTGTTVNGNCVSPELDGLGYTNATTPYSVISVFTNPATGSGMANAILLCAGATTALPPCPICFQ